MSTTQELILSARKCERCYEGDTIYIPEPDPKNSTCQADLMFVNERPGRVGTGQSGYVSFDNDDPSANFFKECFQATGIHRKRIFITNACLCHPNFSGYTDTTPKLREIKNCLYWLERQIEMVQPKLIVTVGRVAFESVLRYANLWPLPGKPKFLDVVGSPFYSNAATIFPVSHTSRLGRVNRPAEQQRADWERIPALLNESLSG